MKLTSSSGRAVIEREQKIEYLTIENEILNEKLDYSDSLSCFHLDQTLDAAMIACGIVGILDERVKGTIAESTMIATIEGACAELIHRMKEKMQ